MALAVSNATTLSAVVGPLIILNKVSNSAIPNIISELVIKKFISVFSKKRRKGEKKERRKKEKKEGEKKREERRRGEGVGDG